MPGISSSKIAIPFGAGGISWSDYWTTLKDLGNTIAWYKPSMTGGAVRDGLGRESIYWDLLIGSSTLLAEQNSGNTVLYAVYEITATQVNYFYDGCQVGDRWICDVPRPCDANNKVKRYAGNHLTQPVVAKQPVNGVFDGVSQFMKTAPFTYDQPCEIFLTLKQITWVEGGYIMDGNTAQSGIIYQHGSSCKIDAYNGSGMGVLIDGPLNEKEIIRFTIDGASSKLRVNELTEGTGTLGGATLGGITIGGMGNGASNFANIEFYEGIFGNVLGAGDYNDNVYRYLKNINSVGSAWFDPTRAIFTFDDNDFTLYTKILPLFISKGVTGTFFTVIDYIGDAGKNTWADLIEIESHGNEIASHGQTHTSFTALTEAQLRTELDNVNIAFTANGLILPTSVAYPSDEANALVRSICAEYYLLGRNVTGSCTYLTDRFAIGVYDISNYTAVTLNDIKAEIDDAILDHRNVVFLCHNVDDPKVAMISDAIDYCASKSVPIINFNGLDSLMP